MDMGLSGKLVLITGAASGIGRATAEAFAKEGARLALIDIDGDQLDEVARATGSEAAGVATAVADLSTKEGVETGIREVTGEDVDNVDVLVNNVGTGAVRSFDDLDDEAWDRTMQLNFYSYVRAIRVVLPGMRKREAGVIVNNSSDLARQPEPVPIDYATSKTAVLGLTKALARSEGPHIRINAVAPGPVWSPFWTKPGGFADTMAKHHGRPPREAVDYEMSLRQIPMNRMGDPEEVADVIVFLASERASYVTSSVYGVDGGSIRNLV
jgi:NAD(P)-dependent dehydrogenase (short-subunit alcohol dehydrogenase family)